MPGVPDQFSKTPLSAPAWMWVAYMLLIVVLALIEGLLVIVAAMFSFQFWTYATWRGAWRSENAAAEDGD